MPRKTIKKEETTEKVKEEEKVTPEQMQQAAATAINSYFTSEINDAVRDLTNDQMFDLLRRLEQSEYWYSILRYNNLRLIAVQSALSTLDPVTSPSLISKNQGIALGISDLQNLVIQLVEIEKQAAKDIKEINDTF